MNIVEEDYESKISNEESRMLTREALRYALFDLLKEKKIDSIKVVDLVKRAGVSRASFYRNYTSINDIISDTIDLTIDDVLNLMNDNFSKNLPSIIAIFRKNQLYLNNLYESGYLHLLLERFNDKFNPDYYRASWAGMYYNVLYIWIKNGMKESSDELIKIIKKCNIKMSTIISKGDIF